jgi:hypothetical protein
MAATWATFVDGAGNEPHAADLNNDFVLVVPIGTIAGWAKTLTGVPALSDRWVECNGQVLSDAASPLNGQTIPNLNANGGGTQYFLRGATASGGTGGADTHLHDENARYQSNAGTGGGDYILKAASSPTQTATASSLPSYYQVVWIMRVK